MIFKREILEMICGIDMTVTEMTKSMYDLECRVEKLEKKLCRCEKACPKKSESKTKEAAKRGRGRPRKNK